MTLGRLFQGVMFLTTLLSTAVSKGQEDPSFSSRWMIRANPLSLIDIWGPSSAQLGIEVRTSERLSFALEGGYFYEYVPRMTTTPDETFNGPLVRAQITRWRSTRRGDWEGGLALDLSYKHLEGECRDSIKPVGVDPFERTYSISRSVFMLRVFRVERLALTDKLSLEVRYGCGIRWKSTISSGITPDEVEAINNRNADGDGSAIPGYQHEVGDRWYPDLIFGLRVGYALD